MSRVSRVIAWPCSGIGRNIAIFAWRSIRRSILRSSLTALSLVIGVAAVIAMVGIGNGAKARVQASLESLDLSRLTLMARTKTATGWQIGFPNENGITIDDYYAIRREIVGFSYVSPRVEVSGPNGRASAKGHSVDARTIGMDVEGFKLESRKLMRGVFFTSQDVDQAENVCVITESAANALFAGNGDPIGELLQINSAPFRIIGVVSDKLSATEVADLNRGTVQIIIPFTSLRKRVDRRADENMQIWMRASAPEMLGHLKYELSNLMELRRGRRKVEFAIFSVADSTAAYTGSSSTLASLLALISAISLIVGGVGIMNVMLMSVKERTREIGIRVAVGARGRDILSQMLLEAIVLSLLGGAIGVVVGVVAARVASRWNEWPMLITPGTILGAFALSFIVGIASGYYPARRAALLNPIEALRMN